MEISKDHQRLTFDMFKNFSFNDLEYVYRGNFSKDMTRKILALAETSLDKTEGQTALKKRIYFIMVEGLQNITRHQDEVEDVDPEHQGLFVIQRKNNRYHITTGNVIEKANISSLKSKLEKVNSLDSEELKKYYRQILTSGKISDKGGAGLGLIEMARKSGNKLIYDFKDFSEEYSYFYFQTEIPLATDKKGGQRLHQEVNTVEYIKDLHGLINQEKIVISFKGGFDQDNLLSLLSIFEGQMKQTSTSIKVYNMMVELLQNIVKHGENIHDEEYGNPGVFYISENPDNFVLTSGNYVTNDKAQIIKYKIEEVNSMSESELTDKYDRVLLDIAINDPKKTGLGFLDMRIKSKDYIRFALNDVSGEYKFYTIQTGIKKS